MTVEKAPPASTASRSSPEEGESATPESRRAQVLRRIGALVVAIRDGDDGTVEAAVRDLSARRRIFAPLGMAVGAFAMLFEGLRLIFTNWRLTLIQILPAMWVWAAMLDIKAHAFEGVPLVPTGRRSSKGVTSLPTPHGWVLLGAILAVAVVTVATFVLNAVFAFAIAEPGRPEIRPAFTRARAHAAIVLGSGVVIGLMLGMAAFYVGRWGRWWFPVSMSIVVGIMMICYVAVPARLIGMKTTYSKADKLKASAVGGVIGAVVCFPPYALGRIGLLMLGSSVLLIPGILVLIVGVTLYAGTTSAVKAIKMSAKLVAGHRPSGGSPKLAGDGA